MRPIRKRGSRAKALAALVTVMVASTLAGCGSGSGSGASEGTVVGVSMPYLTNQFMVSLNDRLVGSLKSAGFSALATTDARSQPDQQVQDVQNLLAGGAKGLVIDPFDSGAIVPALKAAKKADVPVVLVDVGASGGSAYMTVRADNVGAAAMVCEQIGKRLVDRYGEAKGTVLELQGELSSVAGQDRTNGFEDCMKKKYPRVNVIAKPTKWDGTKAANATETVVSSQKVDAVYMQSDCGMLGPVQAALKQEGVSTSVGDPNHVIIGAIDGCPTALKAIRSGKVDFTVEQPLVDYGKRASHFLEAALDGKKLKPGSDGFNGTIRKTKTGLEDIVPATLVTKKNADSKERWGNAKK